MINKCAQLSIFLIMLKKCGKKFDSSLKFGKNLQRISFEKDTCEIPYKMNPDKICKDFFDLFFQGLKNIYEEILSKMYTLPSPN